MAFARSARRLWVAAALAASLARPAAAQLSLEEPVIDSLSPSSIAAGSAGTTLTVNGKYFGLDSIVRVNGSNRTTTYVSSTRVTALLLTSDFATAGTLSITVQNSVTGKVSKPASFDVVNPAPALASISPSSAASGSGAFTLVATGSNFVNGSIVRWRGADRATTFSSSTRLTAAITAADVASAGSANVTVFNPGPGGGTSSSVTFTITSASNPVPAITGLNPSSTAAGSGGFTLTVDGTGFIAGSAVRWNGADRGTTYVSATRLTASIPGGDVDSAGSVTVTVVNPGPGGGTSNGSAFTVTAGQSQPRIDSISPSSATAGGPAFTLTVDGANFSSSSTVRWNGGNRNTTFLNSGRLSAAISAGDIASAGTATVTVFNTGSGGATSNAVTFTVVGASAPRIDSLTPSSAVAGTAAFTLTVNGANFVSGSTVRWNGANRATTFVSSARLSAAIPAGDIASAGSAAITVANPGSGGGSNAVTFTVQSTPTPVVSIQGISDTAGPLEQPMLEVTLASPQSAASSGRVTLAFTPSADVSADDPAIQFATGGRTANFTIPANSTQALFSGATRIGIQTGSVAGRIDLTVYMGDTVASTRSITLRRQAPRVTSVTIGSRTSSGFTLSVVGLSNTRSMTQVTFRFTGSNLATTRVTLDLASQFQSWYQGSTSGQYGGQFLLTVPFTVSGSVGDISSVSVSMTNSEGTSSETSASF